MSQPVFERIAVNDKRRVITDRKKIECKTEILTESINKVLNVGAFTFVSRPEYEKGKINYTGKTVFYICYENSEGQIVKAECGCEYAGSLEDGSSAESCKVRISAEVVKTEFDASQLKLIVIAYADLKAEVTNCTLVEALSSGENLVCDQKECKYPKSLGVRSCLFPIEEEFEVGFPIKEVLYHRADAIITSSQCGVNEIIVDGEVRLSAVLLQKGEKEVIIREERTFPFKAEIESEDAHPSMTSTVWVNEKSFKTDVTVDEEKNLSQVSLALTLELFGEAFSEEEVVLSEDVFSLNEELKIERGEIEVESPLDERTIGVRVSLPINIEDIPENSTLKAVGGERAEVVSFDRREDCLFALGSFSAIGYFMNSEGKFFTRKIETPFEVALDCAFSPEVEFEGYVKAENTSGRIVSNVEIELTAELIFGIRPRKKEKIHYIKSVEAVGEKEINDNAISVYLAREGERLWDLAKRLNSSPEDIQNTNKDLEFPLTENERIVVYRQK